MYQKYSMNQLVNNYLYEEFIAIDFSDEFSNEESEWELDDVFGSL